MVSKREWHRWAHCRLNSLKSNMSSDGGGALPKIQQPVDLCFFTHCIFISSDFVSKEIQNKQEMSNLVMSCVRLRISRWRCWTVEFSYRSVDTSLKNFTSLVSKDVWLPSNLLSLQFVGASLISAAASPRLSLFYWRETSFPALIFRYKNQTQVSQLNVCYIYIYICFIFIMW